MFRMLNSALRFDSSLRLDCVRRFRHTAADIGRLKNPARGGQNLSERYKRLERSSRGKEMLVNQIGGLTPHLPSNYEERSHGNSVKVSNASRPPKKKDITTFRGLEIPQEPREPESDECCMSGCAVCVYDLYEESMDAYKDAVMAFCSSLISLGIPKSEWPPRIRAQSSPVSLSAGLGRQRKVVMSVFEELERALNAKRQDTNSDQVQADSMGPLSSVRRPTGSHPSKKSWWDRWTGVYEGARWIMFGNR